MDSIYLLYGLNFLLMMAVPLVLARLIVAKRAVGWRLFGVGAGTFVLAQVGHVPFNWLVLRRFALIPEENLIALAVFAGLSAGFFEEGGRYLAFRYWARDARTWGRGLMLGAGHGGIEAILLGLLGGWTVIQLALLRRGIWLDQVPGELLPVVQAQITAVFNAPWYRVLLGVVERVLALIIQLSLSLLVMQQFIRGQRRWLGLALGWHTLIDALAVYGLSTWGVYVTELAVGGTAVISLLLIFWLKAPEPETPELEPLPPAGPAPPLSIELTADSLDKSRYTD